MHIFSIKTLLFISITLLLSSCTPDDTSDKFWNAIGVQNNHEPFAFSLSNSTLPTTYNATIPLHNTILNSQLNGIDGNDVNLLLLYNSISDPLYSNVAEEIKFLFDENGNNTLSTIPSYFSALTNYNLDSAAWTSAINTQQQTEAAAKLGILVRETNNGYNVYVKARYSQSISNHNIAVYVYKKNETVNHTMPNGAGTQNVQIKNRLIGAITPTYGTAVSPKSNGGESRTALFYSQGNENINTIGFIAVLYESQNNAPFNVINSLAWEGFND